MHALAGRGYIACAVPCGGFVGKKKIGNIEFAIPSPSVLNGIRFAMAAEAIIGFSLWKCSRAFGNFFLGIELL